MCKMVSHMVPAIGCFFGLSGLIFALAFSSANPAGAPDTSRKGSDV